ncbi:complement C1q tumor necrosis factor-related protein 4-like isoform X2 [Thunnus albacares]|uniref:complement C1q tumor necrosis factor-related protein 4-like isoform X2 n=1 Tax=Thunnus albacares TaxID=8236 RepID=UPI001CF68461|nr:complement C1q tumor necrosis factor-related protein 4-like isoform X2 [Thunnus albacares]
MSLRLSVLLLLTLACLARLGSAQPLDSRAELKKVQTALEELKAERRAMVERLEAAESELKRVRETPKVAFAASLGGNGLQKTTSGNKDLIYRDVLTNVGGAYNAETGEFKAPIRGVYYVRFTANAPTEFTMSAVLYKNNAQIQLITHEQPSGEGSDTASNGAALLLEKGDKLKMVLWHNTQIWDNNNHHSTFSGFLLFPMVDEAPKEFDVEIELKVLQESLKKLQTENLSVEERLKSTEKQLKEMRDVPKVAFAVSLGGNGLQKTTSGSQKLIYKDVLTNIGQTYNSETGEFTAPVRGVYYVRFTANAPTDFPMSAVLYKNDAQIQLIAHEQPSGEGSDTASNGAALLLEGGDRLSLKLWHNTQIWDNSNHHSTFSGFLLFPM